MNPSRGIVGRVESNHMRATQESSPALRVFPRCHCHDKLFFNEWDFRRNLLDSCYLLVNDSVKRFIDYLLRTRRHELHGYIVPVDSGIGLYLDSLCCRTLEDRKNDRESVGHIGIDYLRIVVGERSVLLTVSLVVRIDLCFEVLEYVHQLHISISVDKVGSAHLDELAERNRLPRKAVIDVESKKLTRQLELAGDHHFVPCVRLVGDKRHGEIVPVYDDVRVFVVNLTLTSPPLFEEREYRGDSSADIDLLGFKHRKLVHFATSRMTISAFWQSLSRLICIFSFCMIDFC